MRKKEEAAKEDAEKKEGGSGEEFQLNAPQGEEVSPKRRGSSKQPSERKSRKSHQKSRI